MVLSVMHQRGRAARPRSGCKVRTIAACSAGYRRSRANPGGSPATARRRSGFADSRCS